MKFSRLRLSTVFVLLLMTGATGGIATLWQPLPLRSGPLGMVAEAVHWSDDDEARQAAINPEKDPEIWLRSALSLAKTYRMSGQEQREIDLWWKWLKLYEKSPARNQFPGKEIQALDSLASLYRINGQWAAALPLQILVLKKNPESVGLMINLARTQRMTGLIKEARKTIEVAIESTNPKGKSPRMRDRQTLDCLQEYREILIADGMTVENVQAHILAKYQLSEEAGDTEP